MSYVYNNGDGLAALTIAEPADSDQVLTGAPALRQIKAFLKDPTTTVAPYPKSQVYTKTEVDAIIAALPSPTAFNSHPARAAATGASNLPINGTPQSVPGMSYTASVTGWHHFSAGLTVDNGGGVAAMMQILATFGVNGAPTADGIGSAVPTPPGARWYLGGACDINLTAGDIVTFMVEITDGTDAANLVVNGGQLSGHALST